jgi:hypothetical protein
MSEGIQKQIIFYQNYGGVGKLLCPLMLNQGFKTDVVYCDCEPLREVLSVTYKCGIGDKCPVREISFRQG